MESEDFKTNRLLPNLWIIESEVIPMTKKDRRHAVTHFLASRVDSLFLEHTKNGAPFLRGTNQRELSISYAQKYCVVYFGDGVRVGVDIQEREPRLEKALTIFLTKDEVKLLLNDPYLQTVAWCVKEAVFKRFGGSIHSLKENLTIIELSTTHALVHTEFGNVSLKVIEYTNCVIALTID